MPHAVLNGRDVSLPDAPTLADALRAIGVHLPALCHDERLEPTGACRLCLVRLNGAARPVPACVTPVTEGMTIDTSPPDLEAARRGTLQMLAAGYPAEAARADPDKPFHQEIANHGLDRELGGQTNPAHVDRSHPFITVDMSRCIQCGRCVRICDELQGQFVWHLRDRGADVPHRTGRTRPAEQLVCQLWRMRRHLSDRRPRGRDVRHAGRAEQLDPHRVPVLRHRVRAGSRDSRWRHRVGKASKALTGQQGTPVCQGTLCIRVRERGRSHRRADDP